MSAKNASSLQALDREFRKPDWFRMAGLSVRVSTIRPKGSSFSWVVRMIQNMTYDYIVNYCTLKISCPDALCSIAIMGHDRSLLGEAKTEEKRFGDPAERPETCKSITVLPDPRNREFPNEHGYLSLKDALVYAFTYIDRKKVCCL